MRDGQSHEVVPCLACSGDHFHHLLSCRLTLHLLHFYAAQAHLHHQTTEASIGHKRVRSLAEHEKRQMMIAHIPRCLVEVGQEFYFTKIDRTATCSESSERREWNVCLDFHGMIP